MNSWIVIVDERRIGGMLTAARQVSQKVTAVVVGSADLAQNVSRYSFDEVLAFETKDGVPVEAFASAVASSATQYAPEVVICNDAPASRIIAGAIAGVLDAAVIASVVELKVDKDSVKVSKEVANGKALEDVSVAGKVVAIFAGTDVEVSKDASCSIEVLSLEPTNDRIVGTAEAGGVGLANSLRVIGIGMGIQSKDDLQITDGLARALGAEIACTLPACDDMHWYTADRVLGSSHNQASPELYIAVGISGSPNHTSGFRDAKVVVSINNNPDAEIFHCSQYGIVGDLYKVVPALSAALS